MEESILEQINKKKERLTVVLQNHVDYEEKKMIENAISLAKRFLDDTDEGIEKKEEFFLKFKVAEAQVEAYTNARNAVTGILTF
jgi:ABC-type histidine transport system ATPase subunit